MNPFATHIPVLLACLQYTDGPILELGAGLYSTPLVNAFASQERYARTIEANGRWYGRVIAPLLSVSSKHHELIHSDYEQARLLDHHWSVVLIDHAPARRRRVDMERVRTNADLVIAHDTEEPAYRYEPVFAKFAFRYDFRRYLPHTTVVSHRPLDWLKEVLSMS